MEYNVAMTESANKELSDFLLDDLNDEEICFATWSPSNGKDRITILLNDIIYPETGDRVRHGNVSAMPQYVDRVKEFARKEKKGLIMIHTHPSATGSQGVSIPDLHYEQDVLSREVFGITRLPFVGMTLSGDDVWSARCYPQPYKIIWCSAVRIVGKRLIIHYKSQSYSHSNEKLVRTTSIWGEQKQEEIMRLKVGIIGVGSIGAAVGEILARMGIGKILLMDYDLVKKHNFDRMLYVTDHDVNEKKADIVAKNLRISATNPNFECVTYYSSIVEEDGFREALNCDVLFSCVDRPWPRQVLNHLSYSSLIPVIDGGVSFYIPNGKFVHGMFRAQTVGPERACMECLNAFDAGQVQQDRDGIFDDPEYVKKQETNTKTRQNIMPFVFGLSSLETIQFVELTTNIGNMGDLGQQPYNYHPGDLSPIHKKCIDGCYYVKNIGLGESSRPYLSNDLSKQRESGVQNE